MNTFVVLLTVVTVSLAEANWNHAPSQWNNWGNDAQPKWHGPLALPPGFDKNGAPLPVQDTAEVAAEKAAQLSTLARAGGNVPAPTWNPAAQGGWGGAPHGGWGGPQGGWGGPQGGWAGGPHGGLPVDTPEVAAAKAAHLAAHANAGHGHGRWRRSALLGLAHYTQYPGSTGPLLHTPIVGAWGLHSLPYTAAHWW